MSTFRDLDKHLGSIPAALATAIGDAEAAHGRQEVFRGQNPSVLRTLTEVARIQSTEASNAIEHVTAPHGRIRALVADKTEPANRPEAEIAGYRYVLDTIHSSASDIPFTPNVVLQFHRDLYRYGQAPAGRFKSTDNLVTEASPEGSVSVRFEPVSAFDTPGAMADLHRRYATAAGERAFPRLTLIGAYVLDFLVIHPFLDGNGRMSRLLAHLLLYQGGYEVGRYISLEKLIADSKETYYEALAASTDGWHESTHDVMPWMEYFVGVIGAAYRQFEERTSAVSGRGAKSAAVHQFIAARVSDEFTMDDVRQAAGGISDSLIQKVLRDLRQQGFIVAESRGPGARWRRLRELPS